MVQAGRPQMTVWRLRIACWIPKAQIYTWQATDDSMALAHCMLDTYGYKHTLRIHHYLLLFPLQNRLQERASALRYKYFACPVITSYDTNACY